MKKSTTKRRKSSKRINKVNIDKRVEELFPSITSDNWSRVTVTERVKPQDKAAVNTIEEEDEFKVVSTLDALITSNTSNIMPDLSIDDSDLPEFKNFYDFCFSPMGLQQEPFARQMAIAANLLAEWCPRCSRKSIVDILKVPVDFPSIDFPDKIQFLEYGKCPKCHTTKGELFKSGELNHYGELDGIAGQRSGKSALLSLISPYLIHRWIKAQRPVEVLGLMRNSILVGTFTGLTFAKAVELLWTPIYNAINGCAWFNEMHKLLDYYGETYDRVLYKKNATSLQYLHRNLFFSPSGPNKRTLRGATRVLSALDELGWFPHGKDSDELERASANEVYTALDRSLKTVRTKVNGLVLTPGFENFPNAYALNISSPSSYWDKISTLVRTHRNSTDVYTFQLPTWEMNPDYTKNDFSKEYREDPIRTERDFGANPPMAVNPWIGEMSNILAKCASGSKPKVRYKYKRALNRSQVEERYAELTTRNTLTDQISVLALDAGHTKDSFAFSLMNAMPEPKLANIYAVGEVAPGKGGLPINFARLSRDLIYPLIKEYNVGLVIADRWQSKKLLHDVELDFGIGVQEYSLKGVDFDLIRDWLIDDGEGVRLPPLEMKFDDIATSVDIDTYPDCFRYKPCTHLIHQLMTCSVDQKGVVVKGTMATDDIVRSLCLGLRACTDKKWIKEYNLYGTGERKDMVVAVQRGQRPISSGIVVRMDNPRLFNQKQKPTGVVATG